MYRLRRNRFIDYTRTLISYSYNSRKFGYWVISEPLMTKSQSASGTLAYIIRLIHLSVREDFVDKVISYKSECQEIIRSSKPKTISCSINNLFEKGRKYFLNYVLSKYYHIPTKRIMPCLSAACCGITKFSYPNAIWDDSEFRLLQIHDGFSRRTGRPDYSLYELNNLQSRMCVHIS
jgi:hypothetical protein